MSTAEPTYRLADLAFLDSDLARQVERDLAAAGVALDDRGRSELIAEIVWGLSQEVSFGWAIARGLLTLLKKADAPRRGRYRRMVRRAGRRGATLGWVMATYLVPVLCRNDTDLLTAFHRALDSMAQKGLYTLKPALECLPALTTDADDDAALIYLELLRILFSSELTYSQSQHFSHALPKAARAFATPKRPWQLRRMIPLVQVDALLADAYLSGMEKGLHLLGHQGLKRFVAAALEKYRLQATQGYRFLALSSKAGRDLFRDLQVTVSLIEVEPQLNRYLRARTGRSISIKPFSQLPAKGRWTDNRDLTVCADGRSIFLADTMDRFDARIENQRAYKCLVRFESAYNEFGTFDFDLQRLSERCALAIPADGDSPAASDLELFFAAFPQPELAEDLFLIFEHRRIHRALAQRYPGWIRRYLPMLQTDAAGLKQSWDGAAQLAALYRHLALGMPAGEAGAAGALTGSVIAVICDPLHPGGGLDRVEAGAEMVVRCYPVVSDMLGLDHGDRAAYRPMRLPFGRRIYPDLVYAGRVEAERLAAKIHASLQARGIHLYKSLIRRYLQESRAALSSEVLEKMARNAHRTPDGTNVDTSELARWLSGIEGLEHPAASSPAANPAGGPGRRVSWYWEWDQDAFDYRPDHVRVCDRTVPAGDNTFYADALARHHGMVARIRRAFELLKPEGLKRLRRWVEGDEFDYRALLDHMVDRRAGRTPGDRLYLKRVKRRREVAVLLLVDVSRSTANRVAGTTSSVLDIEKEAIVLFAEALQVVGDEFAIAGYSGTGRLGVDFFRIKGFDEPMGAGVRNRIGGLQPQRNTRMGGAIRHAGGLFAQAEAKDRLVVLLGDGYPNDADYKKTYAFADTYKAIAELRSRNIHVHAITVNLQGAAGSALDTVFGHVRHTLISDVTELPNKLVHIYGTLTRN